MTDEEIVRHWRQAKKRDAAELMVLAELNSTDADSIRQVLEEAGEVPPAPRGRKTYTLQFQELYGQGLTDQEIAGRVGCAKAVVGTWRRRHGLSPHAARLQPEEKSAAPPALPEIYGQMETLLAALPEGVSLTVRRQAGEMLHTLFGEYLIERLELEEK